MSLTYTTQKDSQSRPYLRAGKEQTLDVKLTTTSAVKSATTYWLDILASRYADGRNPWSLVVNAQVTIPASQRSAKGSFAVKFDKLGQVYTIAQVRASRDGPILVSHRGRDPDTVKAIWSILVVLPSDRYCKGTLTLLASDGSEVARFECLGRSQYNLPMMKKDGHTPTGTATGKLGWANVKSTWTPEEYNHSYGPNKLVILTPLTGKLKESQRGGLYIHGGAPCKCKNGKHAAAACPLRPTNGCVRLSDSSQRSLDELINAFISKGYEDQGEVIIEE